MHYASSSASCTADVRRKQQQKMHQVMKLEDVFKEKRDILCQSDFTDFCCLIQTPAVYLLKHILGYFSEPGQRKEARFATSTMI